MVAGVYPGQSYAAQGYPDSGTGIAAPFIAATTTVYAPTLAGTGSATLTAPFIADTTVVYTPTLENAYQVLVVPFIAATTTVYAPTVTATGSVTLTAPFIAATTTVYAPTFSRTGIGAQPLGVSIALDDPTLENAPTWTRLDG